MQTIMTITLLITVIHVGAFLFWRYKTSKKEDVSLYTIKKGTIVYFMKDGKMTAGRVTINRLEAKKLYVKVLGQHAKWDFVTYKNVIEVI